MVKCPECGVEIPEGQMYCSGCGWEVQLVPEFEPEIEYKIDKTLSRLADKIERKETPQPVKQPVKRTAGNGQKSRKKKKSNPLPLLLAAVICVLFVCAGVFLFTGGSGRDAKAAEKYESEGKYERACDSYLRAHEKEKPKTGRYLIRAASIELRQLGDAEGAVGLLEEIINSALYEEPEVTEAYRLTAEACLMLHDTKALQALVEQCPDKTVVSDLVGTLPGIPSAFPEPGVIREETQVTLTAGEGETIYYTTDGSAPDEGSLRYEAPIRFMEGTHTISAVAVSENGLRGETGRFSYTVEKKPVAPPRVMEDSGTYTSRTRIVVNADKDLKIYYSTDEARPPDLHSEAYTGPIEMPEGESVFLFVSADEDGRLSEVVERHYTLELKPLVPEDQAILYVKQALIRAGYMVDESGKVSGQEGVLVYEIDGTVTVGKEGLFYYIREYHLKNDGSRTETGRLYAVHTESGMAKRLGYDSAGKVMLMQF